MKNLVREKMIPVYVDFNGKLEQLSLKEVAEMLFSNKLLYREDKIPLLFVDVLWTIEVFKRDPDDEDVKKRVIYLALIVKDCVLSNYLKHTIGQYAIERIQ